MKKDEDIKKSTVMELLNLKDERYLSRPCNISILTEGRPQETRQAPAAVFYPVLKTSS